MIEDIEPRAPQLGRIRLGKKGAKGQPVKLTKFRFTSHDEVAIKEVADLYGGEPRQWADAPEGEQWEVETDASAIDVLVPPEPMSAFYERWSAAGVARRCTGQTCTIASNGEMVDQPCVCKAKGWTPGDEDDVKKGACDLVSRFNVLLPNVSGLGLWRFDTGSVFGYKELSGQVALLRRMSGSTLDIPAQLCIEQRKIKRPGQQTRQFIVPVLRVRRTLNELVDAAKRGVDTATGELGMAPKELESSRRSTIADFPPTNQAVIYECTERKISATDAHAIAFAITKGRTSSRKDLNTAECAIFIAALADGSWEQLVVAGNQPTTVVEAGPATTDAATADEHAREIAAQEAIPDPAMPAELQRAWTDFANLPADLKAEGFDYLERHAIPKDWHELSAEHITTLVELVESLRMERDARDRDGTAAKPDGAAGQQTLDDGDGVWRKKEWDAAAKAAGTTGPSALKQARTFAADLGVDPPSSLDNITDDSLASRLRGWLDERKSA